jgi:hypothetical protein
MSTTAVLAIIVGLATASLVLNAAFIAHELGWFPHGKRRRDPTLRRAMVLAGRMPTVEEARFNDDDYQTKGPFTDRWRRLAHDEAYQVKDPVTHLQTLWRGFEQQPTASSRDDVINVMNQISTASPVTGELAGLVERITAGLNTAAMPQRGPHRTEG